MLIGLYYIGVNCVNVDILSVSVGISALYSIGVRRCNLVSGVACITLVSDHNGNGGRSCIGVRCWNV